MARWWDKLLGTKERRHDDDERESDERAEAQRRLEALNIRVRVLTERRRQEQK